MSDERYTFESTRVRLDEILVAVRKKDTSLEQSLELLEEGVRLANMCNELIDQTSWKAPESAEGDAALEGASESAGEASGEAAAPAGDEPGDATPQDAGEAGGTADEGAADSDVAQDPGEGRPDIEDDERD